MQNSSKSINSPANPKSEHPHFRRAYSKRFDGPTNGKETAVDVDFEPVTVIVASSGTTTTSGAETVSTTPPPLGQYELVSPEDLIPHPRNVEVYGDEALEREFLDSVKAQGVLAPLLVLDDGTLLSGHRRHKAAMQLGFETVPVLRVHPADDIEALEILLDGNRQRTKSNEQVAREYRLHKLIEAEKAKARLATKTAQGTPVKKFTQAEIGKARDKAAEQLGISGVTADKGKDVVEAIDRLIEEKRVNEAADLREVLNKKSFNAAYKMAQDMELIEPPKARKAKTATAPKAKPAVAAKVTSKAAAVPAPAQPVEEQDPDEAALGHLEAVIHYLETVAADDGELSKREVKAWSDASATFYLALSELGIAVNLTHEELEPVA